MNTEQTKIANVLLTDNRIIYGLCNRLSIYYFFTNNNRFKKQKKLKNLSIENEFNCVHRRTYGPLFCKHFNDRSK